MNVVVNAFGIDLEQEGLFAQRFNVAPTQEVLAVRLDPAEHKRKAAWLRWGLIPSWAKDPKIAYGTINARAETVAEKPVFRAAFRARRCLVVADGYYEWRQEGKRKQPYFFRMRDDRPFAFAGLWERWNAIESCSLITCEPNELQATLHDRMPAILDPVDYDAWLDPNNREPDELRRLLAPFPADEMVVSPVNPIVNNARHEGPECIAPLAE